MCDGLIVCQMAAESESEHELSQNKTINSKVAAVIHIMYYL